MAITIQATAGHASANSFITEVEFIAYMSTRRNVHTGATTSGSTCSEDEKGAMVEATRELNSLTYTGYRVTTTQALQWPREYAPVPRVDTTADDVLGETGVVEYDDDEIPQRIKDATCELALQYCKAGTTDLAVPSSSEGILRKKVDVLETEYAPGARVTRGIARYPLVWAWVSPLLQPTAGGLRVVRV